MLYLAACGEAPASTLALSASSSHSCSAAALDGVVCWGDNENRQTDVPRAFRRGAPDLSVAAGEGFTCASKQDAIACWGRGPAVTARAPSPRLLGGAVQVVAGARHACVLGGEGRVRCWGDDSLAQIRGMPANLRGVSSLAARGDVTCAVASGRVRCWGDRRSPILRVPLLDSPLQVAVGAAHACALSADAVVCWGDNRARQVRPVPRLSRPRALSAGGDTTCALSDEGLACWGGASGDSGARAPRDLTFPTAIAVGGAGGQPGHACAYHLQGIACWGDNAFSQAVLPESDVRLMYRAEAVIEATPAQVWSVLDDLPRYGEWNPFTVKMESTKRVGDPMVMQVMLSGGMTQTEDIRVWVDGYKMCWGMDDALGVGVIGERCQWLELVAPGRTRYVTEDYIAGTSAGLVTLLYGDQLKNGFESVAQSLKQRVERLF